VLRGTGHMFRFTHPHLYGRTILNFLETLNDSSVDTAPVDTSA